MPTGSLHESLSPREVSAVMDAAKQRAAELRREAVDDFWAALGAARAPLAFVLPHTATPGDLTMPTLNLKIAAHNQPWRHDELARALTAITAETLGKRAAVTAVTIEDVPAGHWYVGAQDPQRPTAQLDISITAGTNTAAQKAAFIAAAFAELQRQLAPGATLEEASYVIVREVAASDWGYGGLTQLARQQARERSAETAAA